MPHLVAALDSATDGDDGSQVFLEPHAKLLPLSVVFCCTFLYKPFFFLLFSRLVVGVYIGTVIIGIATSTFADVVVVWTLQHRNMHVRIPASLQQSRAMLFCSITCQSQR